jgi:hypothetical protein
MPTRSGAPTFEPTPPARQQGLDRRAVTGSALPQDLRSALKQVLLQADAAETRWARLANEPRAGLSSLQKLAELMDERIIAARNDREALILPLAAKVDRRRAQVRVVRLLLCSLRRVGMRRGFPRARTAGRWVWDRFACVSLLKEKPHCGQALEERKSVKAQNRTLQGCLLAAKKSTDAAEAERALLVAAHKNIQSVRFVARQWIVCACILDP